MTGSQYKRKYLSGCVHEILTLCRIHKIFFQKYHEKAEIQSFPTMYNTIQSKVDGLAVRSHFLQKTASKTAFWGDTNLDQVTLSSHNSCSKPPNLENCYIFGKLSTSAFRLAIGKPAGVSIVRTAGRYFHQGGGTRKIAKKCIFCFFRFSSKIL